MKLFIDDKRIAPEGYTSFKNAEEFYLWLDSNADTEVELLSLDYYLDDEDVQHENGLKIAKKINNCTTQNQTSASAF